MLIGYHQWREHVPKVSCGSECGKRIDFQHEWYGAAKLALGLCYHS